MSGLADLHRHLDGSLRPATLAELAARAGIAVPADLGFRPAMGLADALACFRITLAVLQDLAAIRRVAAELCDDAAADGVTTLEVRFAPQLHGHPIAAVIDAALDGIAGRAGLVLCARYGDDPAIADALVADGAARPGVVGLDLAGGHDRRAGRHRDRARPRRRVQPRPRALIAIRSSTARAPASPTTTREPSTWRHATGTSTTRNRSRAR